MSIKPCNVWIDIENTPHVKLFTPIIQSLKASGHEVWVTSRRYGYIRELLESAHLEYQEIGTHFGSHLTMKIVGLVVRVVQLIRMAKGRKIDVAVNHGSRTQVVAAWMAGIPCVAMYDYEHVATGILDRFATKIMLPDILQYSIAGNSVESDKIVGYPGLKEELYLREFLPTADFLEQLGLSSDKVLVVLRPPATTAHYHRTVTTVMFDRVLDHVSSLSHVNGIVVPRTDKQVSEMHKVLSSQDNLHVLERPVDGLNLIWYADLLIGAGGTMNREAAMLGVPAYSVFMGEIGAVDSALQATGKLVFLRSTTAIEAVKFEKRKRVSIPDQARIWEARSLELVKFITDHILAITRVKRS